MPTLNINKEQLQTLTAQALANSSPESGAHEWLNYINEELPYTMHAEANKGNDKARVYYRNFRYNDNSIRTLPDEVISELEDLYSMLVTAGTDGSGDYVDISWA